MSYQSELEEEYVEFHTLYWDEYRYNWTSKEIAFRGHLFKKVQEIVNENKVEKFKDLTCKN